MPLLPTAVAGGLISTFAWYTAAGANVTATSNAQTGIKTVKEATLDDLNIVIGVTWKASFTSVNLSDTSGDTKVWDGVSATTAKNNKALVKAGWGYFSINVASLTTDGSTALSNEQKDLLNGKKFQLTVNAVADSGRDYLRVGDDNDLTAMEGVTGDKVDGTSHEPNAGHYIGNKKSVVVGTVKFSTNGSHVVSIVNDANTAAVVDTDSASSPINYEFYYSITNDSASAETGVAGTTSYGAFQVSFEEV